MILHLTVKPGSRNDEFIVNADGSIRVKIKEQAIEGKANKYLLKYLSEIFAVPKSKIEILKGENNQHKKVSIAIDDASGTKIIERFKQLFP
ncbi:MAG: hypothetical protein POELPBGB_02744 [Bacteroidia bacterium]|nr:hypothetical protein [Bacteroidia bacterium]